MGSGSGVELHTKVSVCGRKCMPLPEYRSTAEITLQRQIACMHRGIPGRAPRLVDRVGRRFPQFWMISQVQSYARRDIAEFSTPVILVDRTLNVIAVGCLKSSKKSCCSIGYLY